MNQVTYTISASQACDIFKIVCDRNSCGFKVSGQPASMNYEGIQKALVAFVGIQMHAAEVSSRLSDYSEYGSDRREYVPRYNELKAWYSKQYADQPNVVKRLSYAINPDIQIERLFSKFA